MVCIDEGGNKNVTNTGPKSLGRSLIYRNEEGTWWISLEGKMGSDLEMTIKNVHRTAMWRGNQQLGMGIETDSALQKWIWVHSQRNQNIPPIYLT